MPLWTQLAVVVVLLAGGFIALFAEDAHRLYAKWQQQRRAMTRRRTELRALATTLHGSNAWDCGCWEHVAERVRTHGDIRGMGLLARRRRLLGFIPYEVIHLSKEQKQELSDD